MDFVWAHPGCTADDCRSGLESYRVLKDSTVRTLLRRLEEKGYATHKIEGRTYLYQAAHRRDNVAVDAVRGIMDRFCGGSVEELLVGLVDHEVIRPKELEDLARKIAARKKGKK
jgi:predicted transcriptional regulator